MPNTLYERLGEPLRRFLALESAGGLAPMAAAVAGFLIDNSPLTTAYEALLNLEGALRVGTLAVEKPVFLWVNDLWMAVFFFLVAMEIKQEALDGCLADRRAVVLPAAAALGGIVLPAAIYVALNAGDARALVGWAIPTATDIAFALGVLSLLGARAPASLKVLLMTLAVLDDLAAIVIIALFYTSNLSGTSLALAAVGLAALVAMNRLGVTRVAAYVLVGMALWVCVLKSGVHATLAGVALGFAVPGKSAAGGGPAPLEALIHALHPWVAFAILPAFAFVNAGVSLAGIDASALFGGVPLGIALGLFVGKPLGVLAFIGLAVALRFARLPDDTTWPQIVGMALLCGVGFTMSLFIGGLAFAEGGAGHDGVDRLAIILGSLAAGLAGYLVLRLAGARANG
jgi:Na+:H+ antiporter, NhaA family